MRKSFTEDVGRQPIGEEKYVEGQFPLELLATLEDVQQGFFSLCVAAGREVLTAMMEREREALCGPHRVRRCGDEEPDSEPQTHPATGEKRRCSCRSAAP